MTGKDQSLIKIIIIEDNRYMREGWKTILDFEDDFVVIGSYESCEEAFESDTLAKGDLALMDIELPGMSGIEGVKKLRRQHPDLIIIMATVFDDDKHVFDALCAGAVGYLMKKVSPEDLIKAIHDAHEGGSPMTPNIARKVINTFHNTSAEDNEANLSERELEILEELAKGKSYAKIGESIYLSVDGVRYHIRNIYKKLEVNSRTEAVSKGISQRLINPE
ncbi:response regulator transcription factor [Aliifodinibius sp. S!AR15-10]|uniref:response regulator transcription factor n=1 Tax=Aliifodinibius sp. S!AR15-10 TaxID=2950437 RepID=UPI0028627493|nr:response regulator transcription factor [Aliifodinibius sp. S!AR15-10]MDR8394420.1 response regulator transcription factor [Aliifodinibius sp. S!AR15-10]